MSVPVYATQSDEVLLAALQANVLSGASPPKVGLFQNSIAPGPGTVFTDLNDATFTGYVAGGSVWGNGTPILDAVDNRYMIPATSPLNFTVGSPVTTPNTIYGWYLYNDATTPKQLIMAERFDTPIEMDAPGKTIQLLLNMKFTGLDAASALED